MDEVRAVVRVGAALSAVRSLATWGAINLVCWYALGGDDRRILGGIHNPSASIYFLLYGGAVLGCFMVAFAALGLATRTVAIIALDGFSLLCVGVWNVVHDFVAIEALREHGYTVNGPGGVWVLLGVSQVMWGFRQFGAFSRIAAWQVADTTPDVFARVKSDLKTFVARREDPATGVVKGSITSNGPFGLSFLSRTMSYTGVLLPDAWVMVATGLDDCFIVPRETRSQCRFGKGGSVVVDVSNTERTVVLTPGSQQALREWVEPGITDDAASHEICAS
jgi:hypothetical protein